MSDGGAAIWRRISGYYPRPSVVSGAKLDMIGELSARYAHCILSHTGRDGAAGSATGGAALDAVSAFALWLSLIWVVDEIFDSKRSASTPRGQKLVELAILAAVTGAGGTPAAPPADESEPMNALVTTVSAVYSAYARLCRPHRARSPGAFDMVTHWLLVYLGTVRDSRSDGLSSKDRDSALMSALNIDATLGQYVDWRLRSGAMMCVVYQVALFATPTDVGLTDVQLRALRESTLCKEVALQAALYNDLLSLDRDLKQDTPNFVLVIAENTGVDLWSAAARAVSIVNRISDCVTRHAHELRAELPGAALVADWCEAIVTGSSGWHDAEQRYRKGSAMLRALSTGDRAQFELLLEQ